MPSWLEVQKEIIYFSSLNPFDMVREKYLSLLHKKTERNIICYYSGWLQKENPSAIISEEDMNAFMSVIHGLGDEKNKGLDLILHTPGGNLTATEAVIHYLMEIFNGDIRAFIPQVSMSAGTIIACASKEIWMGKQSSLGPIDPQFNGIPAQGIIEEFECAVDSIKKEPTSALLWQTILSKYHPTLLGEAKKAIKLSKEMCSNALKNNMFKNNKKKVAGIVNWLSSHGESKAHARHFDMKTCQHRGLNIKPLEKDDELQDLVLTLHHAYMHTFANTPATKIIENHNQTRIVFQQKENK